MSALTRAWNEAVAAVAALVRGGVPTLEFLSFLLALVVGLAWYFWPAWLPWRWRLRRSEGERSRAGQGTGWRGRFRLGSLRWRWRRRRRSKRPAEPIDDLPPDLLPDLPAEVLALTADQLAAASRYAEAVRERLRAIVRDLIERDVIPFSPGWTVTELAAAAGRDRPSLARPLADAVTVFSDIWYGLRPAGAADDTAMRGHAETIRRALADRAAPVGSGS